MGTKKLTLFYIIVLVPENQFVTYAFIKQKITIYYKNCNIL